MIALYTALQICKSVKILGFDASLKVPLDTQDETSQGCSCRVGVNTSDIISLKALVVQMVSRLGMGIGYPHLSQT